jgi:hypothetical protein
MARSDRTVQSLVRKKQKQAQFQSFSEILSLPREMMPVTTCSHIEQASTAIGTVLQKLLLDMGSPFSFHTPFSAHAPPAVALPPAKRSRWGPRTPAASYDTCTHSGC